MLCLSWNSRDKRANQAVPHRQKEARRSNTRPMAERQVFMLGLMLICPLAESYVTGLAREAGAAVELATYRKEEKCASIGSDYLFAPIAVETLGPMNTSACQLFANLGIKISTRDVPNIRFGAE